MFRSLLHLVMFLAFFAAAAFAQATRPSSARTAIAEQVQIKSEEKVPDRFLREHLDQLSYPGAVDDSYLYQYAQKSFKKQQDIKFRGKSKGSQRVWNTLGPATLENPNPDFVLSLQKNISGRVTALAMGRECRTGSRCLLFLGTAGGGVWRTRQALLPEQVNWEHLSGVGSNNIGAITLDPNDLSDKTVYVGTGESNSTLTSGTGKGLYKSIDGGDTFTQIPTMILDPGVSLTPVDFTATRGISAVRIKPGDHNTIYVATTTAMQGMTAVRGGQSVLTGGPQAKVGLYRTTNGGATWSLLLTPSVILNVGTSGAPFGFLNLLEGVKDVKLDPKDPDTVYAAVLNEGIYRSSVGLESGDATFKLVYRIVASTSNLRINSNPGFDLTVKDGKTRIYVYNGTAAEVSKQGLYRVDNADVPAVVLNAALVNTPAWISLTLDVFNTANPQPFTSSRICGAQCFYNLAVAVPTGRPDTVVITGTASRVVGIPSIRSTDAGFSFQNLDGIDLQPSPGFGHVDVRAIAFSPNNPNIVFIGSDGGLIRTDGIYADGTYLCAVQFPNPNLVQASICPLVMSQSPNRLYFMNKGLQTMQFFNVSADPGDPLRRIIGGAQDNSTQWFDGTRSPQAWSTLFGLGDGTAANGFNAANPNTLFASFQSNSFFTHFNGGVGGTLSWLFTGGPIRQSGEQATPGTASGRQFLTFDPIYPDTQFTGFESIWRTQNNGGDRTLLEGNCTTSQLITTGVPFTCGDWKRLGTLAGSANKLTGAFYGNDDRRGGIIVAAERTKSDNGTLWAATSLGRVFVSHNVSVAIPEDVTFKRLDNLTAAAPRRFISGIAVDPSDPSGNTAFISYSGFSALTPAAAGHVFRVVYDPGTNTVTYESLDHDLGDMPINHIVLDDLTGDLYVATDFGVLRLPNGATQWEEAAIGLPPVLTPHLEIHPQKRFLFAATHGLGVWYMNLP